MDIEETFYIRRYWLRTNTPKDVLDTLNYRRGTYHDPDGRGGAGNVPYVDINYYGEGDKTLTMMELKYAEWIADRQQISYTVTGSDGL